MACEHADGSLPSNACCWPAKTERCSKSSSLNTVYKQIGSAPKRDAATQVEKTKAPERREAAVQDGNCLEAAEYNQLAAGIGACLGTRVVLTVTFDDRKQVFAPKAQVYAPREPANEDYEVID